MRQDPLMQRWVNLFPDASLDRTLHAWSDIKNRYGENHRHYHTLRHIAALLAARDNYFPESSRCIELAIWFHDLIYIPGDEHNELLSAHLCRFWLTYLGESEAVIDETCQIILVTLSHLPKTTNEAIMCDLDLLSLAAEPDDYVATTARIKLEFRVWEAYWAQGRLDFIDRFLNQRDHIFHTQMIQEWFEQVARNNLERERATLLSDAC